MNSERWQRLQDLFHEAVAAPDRETFLAAACAGDADLREQVDRLLSYRNAAQRGATERYVAKVLVAKVYREPVVTEVSPLTGFHPAEDYHQDYMAHHPTHPYIAIDGAPKLEALRRQFPALYRKPG